MKPSTTTTARLAILAPSALLASPCAIADKGEKHGYGIIMAESAPIFCCFRPVPASSSMP